MLKARINIYVSELGRCWICRLYEPGGYTWYGQVAHTTYEAISKEEFIKECVAIFGPLNIEE